MNFNFEMTKELQELKDSIDGSIDPVEVYDNSIFGPHYKYTIPLFCAENGYKCLYQPSRVLYVIYRMAGENRWESP